MGVSGEGMGCAGIPAQAPWPHGPEAENDWFMQEGAVKPLVGEPQSECFLEKSLPLALPA